METKPNKIREEEVKNVLREDFFKEYDATPILGDIDFAVTLKTKERELFDKEFFLWAEAKRNPKDDLIDSFIQLIITIGKAKAHEKWFPPFYLGAFDSEKIAFVEFHKVIGALYNSEINWNVTPSNHKSDTFLQLKCILENTLKEFMSVFKIKKDEIALRKFIKNNFRQGKDKTSRICITRNNFMFVFQRWVEEVKPSIAVEWNDVPSTSVVDFFYADLISRDDYTRSEELAVVLRGDRYKILQQILKSGTALFSEAFFNDQKAAYRQFWNKYERPPRKDYLGVILERRDLLIPHNLRQYQGAFFTPPQWVQKSQEYLAEELGDNWQQDYYVWDCCAGTGNLLYGLTEKHRVWASDLSSGFVQVMKERIRENSLNLYDDHVFKFDFLNDSFDKLPERLQTIINDPEERKKLVIYINPPFVEAADQKTVQDTGKNKKDVSVSTMAYKKYAPFIGIAGRELFAQFFARISEELRGVILGNFCTLKLLQGPSFAKFRKFFHAELRNMFVVPSYTFDNVDGKFPVGFFIWNTNNNQLFQEYEAVVYDASDNCCGKKFFLSPDNKRTINDWIKETRNRDNAKKIGFMSAKGCDFQNQDYTYIVNKKELLPHPRGSYVEDTNLLEICIYYAVRHSVQQDWMNNQDQFFAPLKTDFDENFITDCLVYTLFSEKNLIQSKNGTNHWIPFEEKEVGAREVYKSHFMTDFISGKKRPLSTQNKEGELFQDNKSNMVSLENKSIVFSEEAKSVLEAAKYLWIYYHKQPKADANASLYDIRIYFQGTKTDAKGKEKMNDGSSDNEYLVLLNRLRYNMSILERVIASKVYKYGFLLNNNKEIYEQYKKEIVNQSLTNSIDATESVNTNKKTTVVKKKVQRKKTIKKSSNTGLSNSTNKQNNINVTINFNKFEKPVGAVVLSGGQDNIKDIVDVKRE